MACRRFAQADRWNGHAPHPTTGAASVSDNHCQAVNCSAGTIAIATTGTVRTAEMTSRCRRTRAALSCWSCAGPSTRVVPAGGSATGTVAV